MLIIAEGIGVMPESASTAYSLSKSSSVIYRKIRRSVSIFFMADLSRKSRRYSSRIYISSTAPKAGCFLPLAANPWAS